MLFTLTLLIGAVLGLAAHDLGVQGLSQDLALKPWVGTCPRCQYENGMLRARCLRCDRTRVRELLVAALSAAAALGFVGAVGVRWPLLAYAAFLLLSGSLLVTDLEAFRIVDRLNLRGTVILAGLLGVIAAVTGEYQALGRGLAGAGLYFAGALTLWLIARGRGFGGGDVKLAPQLGLFTAYLSWGTLGWATFFTAIIGGVVAFALLATGKARGDTELPYGPPMILGAWLAIALSGLGLP